jgi:hypothetical protein
MNVRSGVRATNKRRLRSVGSCVLVAMVCVAGTTKHASAITNGTADGDRHPYVGAIILDSQLYGDVPNVYVRNCTGTLVAPTLVLTAAHCFEVAPPDHAWVSFDSTYVPGPQPPAIHGTAVLYPGWDETGIGDFMNDFAVIHLDAPVDITPAHLPPAGLLDSIDLRTQRFDTAGYGRTRYDKTRGPHSIEPRSANPVTRNYASFDFRNLRTQDQWIIYSENLAKDASGTCNGDSGGATFLAGTDIMVSTLSVADGECRNFGGGPRLDTASARAFLKSQGVPLP